MSASQPNNDDLAVAVGRAETGQSVVDGYPLFFKRNFHPDGGSVIVYYIHDVDELQKLAHRACWQSARDTAAAIRKAVRECQAKELPQKELPQSLVATF